MRWRQRPATARLVMALPVPPVETTRHARSLVAHSVSTIQIHPLGPKRPTQSGTESSRLGRRPDANNLPHMSDSTFAAQPHTLQPGGQRRKGTDGGRSTSDHHPLSSARFFPTPSIATALTKPFHTSTRHFGLDDFNSSSREPERTAPHKLTAPLKFSLRPGEGGCDHDRTSPPP